MRHLFVPADFIVVDYEEDKEMPILLGRPFLDTADASLKMRRRVVKMKIGGEKLLFNADEITKFSRDSLLEQVSMMDSVEEESLEVMEAMSSLEEDELETFFKQLETFTEPMSLEESQTFEALEQESYSNISLVSEGSEGSSKVSRGIHPNKGGWFDSVTKTFQDA